MPDLLIWSPLKVATPLAAARDVVPPAKEPVDNVSLTVSVEPVFPVVMVFPNWSSTATVVPKFAPAPTVAGGWAVTTSLFSAAGLTVIWFVVAVLTPVRLVSEAVMVKLPTLVS